MFCSVDIHLLYSGIFMPESFFLFPHRDTEIKVSRRVCFRVQTQRILSLFIINSAFPTSYEFDELYELQPFSIAGAKQE